MVLDITRHPQAYEQPFPHPPWSGAGSRHARIQASTADQLATQKRQIDELYARLERVERHSPRGLVKRIVRLVQRTFRRS